MEFDEVTQQHVPAGNNPPFTKEAGEMMHQRMIGARDKVAELLDRKREEYRTLNNEVERLKHVLAVAKERREYTIVFQDGSKQHRKEIQKRIDKLEIIKSVIQAQEERLEAEYSMLNEDINLVPSSPLK